jgi:hypothetical protein
MEPPAVPYDQMPHRPVTRAEGPPRGDCGTCFVRGGSMAVRAAAEELVARAAAVGLRGRTLTPGERQQVAAALPVYPAWLLELLSSVPLCGLRLGWQAYPPEPDFDGVLRVEVSDAAGILSESLELYPGLAIAPAGTSTSAAATGRATRISSALTRATTRRCTRCTTTSARRRMSSWPRAGRWYRLN